MCGGHTPARRPSSRLQVAPKHVSLRLLSAYLRLSHSPLLSPRPVREQKGRCRFRSAHRLVRAGISGLWPRHRWCRAPRAWLQSLSPLKCVHRAAEAIRPPGMETGCVPALVPRAGAVVAGLESLI